MRIFDTFCREAFTSESAYATMASPMNVLLILSALTSAFAGPSALRGGAGIDNVTAVVLPESESSSLLEAEAETLAASTGGFCVGKSSPGWFCMGTTHVKCCRSGAFWVQCGSVARYSGCGFWAAAEAGGEADAAAKTEGQVQLQLGAPASETALVQASGSTLDESTSILEAAPQTLGASASGFCVGKSSRAGFAWAPRT